MIALPDGAEFVGALFGTLELGGVVVMVNPALAPDDIAYLVELSRAKAIVTHRDVAGAVPRRRRRRTHAVHGAGGRATRRSTARSPARRDDVRDVSVAPRRRGDLAVLRRHHGTAEGRRADASLVRQHHRVLRPGRARLSRGRRHARGAQALLRLRHRLQSVLSVLGRRFVRALPGALDTRGRCSTASAGSGPTILINVPTMVPRWWRTPTRRKRTSRACVSRPRPARRCRWSWTAAGARRSASSCSTASAPPRCGTSSSPIVPARRARARSARWCPDSRSRRATTTAASCRTARSGAVGARRLARDRLLAEHGQDDATVFRGDWYVTGDLVAIDADGFVTYGGRGDEMLKVSGKWLAPQEVESCLLQHPAGRRGRRRRRARRERPDQAVRLRRRARAVRRARRGAQGVRAASGSIPTSSRARSCSSTRCRARTSARWIAASCDRPADSGRPDGSAPRGQSLRFVRRPRGAALPAPVAPRRLAPCRP